MLGAPFRAVALDVRARDAARGRRGAGPFWFERMVLCAPMLRLPLGPLGPRGLRTLTGTMAMAGLSACRSGALPVRTGVEVDFAENCLTSDRDRFLAAQAMIDAAPELTVGPPTVGWLSAAARAMDACFDLRLPRRVQVPVLFVGAARDTVVSTWAAEKLAQRMRSGSYVMIPNAKHEILMERDELREQFWGRLRRLRARRYGLAGQPPQRLRMDPGVAGRDDIPATLRASAVERRHHAPRRLDDRNERHHVIGLHADLDDEVDLPHG